MGLAGSRAVGEAEDILRVIDGYIVEDFEPGCEVCAQVNNIREP